jgi:hypothetical protein
MATHCIGRVMPVGDGPFELVCGKVIFQPDYCADVVSKNLLFCSFPYESRQIK